MATNGETAHQAPSGALDGIDAILCENGVHVTFREKRAALARVLIEAGITGPETLELLEHLRATGARNLGGAFAKLVENGGIDEILEDVRKHRKAAEKRAPRGEPDHVRKAPTMVSARTVRCCYCEADGIGPFFDGGGDFDDWPDWQADGYAGRAFCRSCGAELLQSRGALEVKKHPTFGGRGNPWTERAERVTTVSGPAVGKSERTEEPDDEPLDPGRFSLDF